MKQKIRVLVPLAVIAAMLVYCWATFLTTDLIASWRHYAGIILYLLTVLVFFRNLRWATFIVGVYLLLATFSLLGFTPAIETSWVSIGPVSTPPVQLFSLGLFVFYFVLNLNAMIEYYLDYKEAKQVNK